MKDMSPGAKIAKAKISDDIHDVCFRQHKNNLVKSSTSFDQSWLPSLNMYWVCKLVSQCVLLDGGQ